jgi:osmotically inducible lipoprotein OsmB
MNRLSILLIAGGFLLTACGSTPGDRSITGGAMGAGVGALAGLAVGFPITGALFGGALGATAGALSDPSQIYLGKPVWR